MTAEFAEGPPTAAPAPCHGPSAERGISLGLELAPREGGAWYAPPLDQEINHQDSGSEAHLKYASQEA